MLVYSEELSKRFVFKVLYSHPENEFLRENEALTNGFCFVNNVAIAAGYLKHMYRDQIK